MFNFGKLIFMHNLDYQRYYRQDFFEMEREKLFNKLWIFGCSVSDLPENDTYYLAQMPFGDVVISRTEDKFYAFYNKCLHRGHPIVTSKRGKSNFVCPYHNWCYGKRGELFHIPGGEKFYGASKDEYSFEELQKVSLERLGDFLFLNASTNPLKITDQFDQSIIESLEKTRDKFSSVNLSLSLKSKFNWKLIFENLRDPLHPIYLHPKSLTQEVDFYSTDKDPTGDLSEIKDIKEISCYSRDGDLRSSTAEYKKWFEHCDNGENYLNWLLFPFTHIPSPDGGVLYAVENYVPISANETRFDLHLYITKSKGRVPELAVLYEWLMKAKIVLTEDFDAICRVQEVINQSDQNQYLGNYELQNLRINRFLDKVVYENS